MRATLTYTVTTNYYACFMSVVRLIAIIAAFFIALVVVATLCGCPYHESTDDEYFIQGVCPVVKPGSGHNMPPVTYYTDPGMMQAVTDCINPRFMPAPEPYAAPGASYEPTLVWSEPHQQFVLMGELHGTS